MRCLIVLLVFLSACTALPEKTRIIEDIPTPFLVHEKALQAIDNWQFKGRFAISSDKDAWSGSLRWQQVDKQYSIHVLGPLFYRGVMLSGDDRYAKLTMSSETYQEKDAETLLYRHTGLRFPFNHLKYWMFGLISPDLSISARMFDAAGQLEVLEQEGWLVSFKKYAEVEDVVLPKKLFLEHPGLRIRLVFDHWDIQG